MKQIIYAIIILSLSSPAVHGQAIGPPQNLSVEWRHDSGVILLQWDSLEENIAGYNVYVRLPGRSKLVLWSSAGIINKNEYEFHPTSDFGGEYGFSVAGIKNFPEVSYGRLSEVKVIKVPPAFIPTVNDFEAKEQRHTIKISWSYNNDVYGLSKFVLNINGVETEIASDKRYYEMKEVKPGTYSIFLSARTESGLSSGQSAKKIIQLK